MPFFSTPEYYTKRLNYLSEHAVRYGRDPREIDPSVWVYTAITDDAELARNLLGQLAIFCIAERGSLKHAGYDLSKLPSKQFNFSRLVVSNNERIEALVKAAADVPLDLVKKMHAVGTVEEVTAHFQAHINAGVRHFIINPCAGPDVDGTLATFSSEVMPRLRNP